MKFSPANFILLSWKVKVKWPTLHQIYDFMQKEKKKKVEDVFYVLMINFFCKNCLYIKGKNNIFTSLLLHHRMHFKGFNEELLLSVYHFDYLITFIYYIMFTVLIDMKVFLFRLFSFLSPMGSGCWYLRKDGQGSLLLHTAHFRIE